MKSCKKTSIKKNNPLFSEKNHCFPTCALFYPIVLKRKIITGPNITLIYYTIYSFPSLKPDRKMTVLHCQQYTHGKPSKDHSPDIRNLNLQMHNPVDLESLRACTVQRHFRDTTNPFQLTWYLRIEIAQSEIYTFFIIYKSKEDLKHRLIFLLSYINHPAANEVKSTIFLPLQKCLTLCHLAAVHKEVS